MEYLTYFLILLFLMLLGLLFYISQRRKYTYWEQQNLPQMEARILLGSYTLNSKPLQELEHENYKKFGRIYGRYDGQIPVLCVAEPELLKRVLVKDFHLFQNRRDMRLNDSIIDNTLFALEGENWKRVRTVVSPTLTSSKLKKMLPLMKDCADLLIENLDKTVEEKKNVNCQRVFGAFTIDTIARCAFGMTINSLMSEDQPFVEKAKKLLDCSLSWRTSIIMICPILMKWFRIRLLNPETTEFYRRIILEVVEERKKIRGREDFLQHLLDTQTGYDHNNNNNVKTKSANISSNNGTINGRSHTFSETGTNGRSNMSSDNGTIKGRSHSLSENGTNGRLNKSSDNGAINGRSCPLFENGTTNGHLPEQRPTVKSLSHDEFIAQCVTFFMAGYDSTTSLLSYVIYNLAMHEEYQERVVEEMESVLKEYDGVLSYESLSEMKFLEAVLYECLRLCPPMIRNERRVEEDCVLGDTNIRLQKGMLISIPIYAIHRDPEWYPEPDVFKPERFYEPDPNRPQYVYLAFGAGPRLCVGLRFVMMQVKLCLVRVLQRYRAQPASTTPRNLGFTEVRNVLKVNSVEMSFVRRQQT